MMNGGHKTRGPMGLSRDPEHGILAGVCSGIALRLGLNPWTVRIAVLILGLLFSVATVLAYLLAVVALPRRGLEWHGRQPEREFWRSGMRDADLDQRVIN